MLQLVSGDFAAAVDTLTVSLADTEDDEEQFARWLLYLGAAYAGAGDVEAALATWTRALNLPENRANGAWQRRISDRLSPGSP